MAYKHITAYNSAWSVKMLLRLLLSKFGTRVPRKIVLLSSPLPPSVFYLLLCVPERGRDRTVIARECIYRAGGEPYFISVSRGPRGRRRNSDGEREREVQTRVALETLARIVGYSARRLRATVHAKFAR